MQPAPHATWHLFQGRYKAILAEKDSHLLELARYVVLNPVRESLAGSCRDWRWSSYRATAELESAAPFLTIEWILSQFERELRKAQRAYRRFVFRGRGETVWEKLRGQIYFGSDAFIEEHSPVSSGALDEIPRTQRLVGRPSLVEVFASTPQDRAVVNAYRECGYTLRDIAESLGVHYSTVSRRLKREEDAQGEAKMCHCKT